MKTRAGYLVYLLILIALVICTHAAAPIRPGESRPARMGRIPLPLTELPPAPADGSIDTILASAAFDFSFTASIRDSLRYARVAAIERTILRFSRRALRVPDRRMTVEVLSMQSMDSLAVSPATVRLRVEPWEPYIRKYSREYGIDPNFVRAIIYAESSGDPDVVSHRGAMGLMQLMPETVEFVGISDPFNPEQNIMGGLKYISWLASYAGDNAEAHILWAWHAGPALPEQLILPQATRDFILKVLAVKRQLDRSGANNAV